MTNKRKHINNQKPRQPRLGDILRRVLGTDGQWRLALQVCGDVAKGAA